MARFKLTAKQAEDLIKQLGVDAELVADDQADKDFKPEEAIGAVDESRSRIFKPDIEERLRTELTASLAGQFGGALRATLRRLSNNQLKTSDLDGLKDPEAIQKFLDHMLGQKDASLEDIREQQRKQTEEWEAEKAKILAEEQQKYNTLKSQYTERDIDSIVEEALGKVPRTGGNIKVQAQLAKAYVRSKYKDHFDEAKRIIELRDMANPEKIALNGNVAIQLGDVLTEFAKENGILKTDNRNEDPNKVQQEHQQHGHTITTQFGGGNYQKDQAAFEAQLGISES